MKPALVAFLLVMGLIYTARSRDERREEPYLRAIRAAVALPPEPRPSVRTIAIEGTLPGEPTAHPLLILGTYERFSGGKRGHWSTVRSIADEFDLELADGRIVRVRWTPRRRIRGTVRWFNDHEHINLAACGLLHGDEVSCVGVVTSTEPLTLRAEQGCYAGTLKQFGTPKRAPFWHDPVLALVVASIVWFCAWTLTRAAPKARRQLPLPVSRAPEQSAESERRHSQPRPS